MADKLLTVKSGKGKELCDLLRKELGLPGIVVSFSVHFAVDEAVTVDCKYLPREPQDG